MASEHFTDRAIRGLMLGTLLLALATWRRPIHEPGGMTQRNVRRNIDAHNLRAIVQARLANESKTKGGLPTDSLANVHALAGYLARSGLTDASLWFSRIDPVLNGWPQVPVAGKPGETHLTPILDSEDKHELAPAFRAAPLAWAVALVSSISELPPETPGHVDPQASVRRHLAGRRPLRDMGRLHGFCRRQARTLSD